MGTNLLVGYTGAYQDPVTGGYPLGNGYRMYLPELMRFNSPDSWSPFGQGGVNPYDYCEDDPINHSDPSGHFAFLAGLGLQILVIGFMVMPGGQEVRVATEEMAMPVLEAENATTVATSEGVGGVIPEAIPSTSRATGVAEDLASDAEMPQLDGPYQPGRVWRPFDWDAPAPAPAPTPAPPPIRPTIQDLIQRARAHVHQNPGEVAAHYWSFITPRPRGLRDPDWQKLLIHQFARELEQENVYAEDLQGFTTRYQLARDLGNRERIFSDMHINARRRQGSRRQISYVLHRCFNQQIDPGGEAVDIGED